MTKESGAAARRARLVLLVPAQAALMVLLGLLVTGLPPDRWPLSADDRITRAFAAHRGPFADGVTHWLSAVASTEGVVGVTLVAVVALLVLPRAPRWTEAVFLGASVAAQSAVFLTVTLCVERPRPDVPHLDAAPPTSSFPSGHVGASLALYGGLATLALTRMRGPWRYVTATLLLLVPPAVGLSRVYRGMHHPTDVAGGLLNGTLTLLVMAWVFLSARTPATPTVTGSATAPAAAPGSAAVPAARGTGRRAVVVRHPHSCGDELARRVRAALHDRGYTDQHWTETSAERPCGALAEECAASETALVVVCGGDGTVRACADVAVATGHPLVLVPCGTGNLLARNLGLPTDPATALDAALDGAEFRIDAGRVSGDGLAPTRFTVMTGAGFDAAMVRDASPGLKARVGWAAYALSASRHLGDPRMRLSVSVDGGRPRRRRARMVVVGNVGALQGGLELLPGARPDSGRLEVVLFDPRGATGWLAAAGHLAARTVRGRTPAAQAPGAATGRTGGTGPAGGREARGSLEYFSGTRIDIRFAGAQPREVDGDTFPEGTRLTAEAEPGALRVRLPRAPGTGERLPATGSTDTRLAPHH
ncbi:diacylglycerol kinase family protein [Streptomyces subrutilus]|uniref:DAGKc domain-containing protein n=2 Tax=Streptomyces subrutilus TaxID=36818 RepID=A0A918QVT6_9ACTN|nr:diacylglycerol kinase family protein [Streptomyces subrutilus]WSJ28478.1 diacylglycerol kinase family protein [Streptomyces subrutilus]GGZ72951.1 hypothetical protein GCM10010371_36140 [Streptomyces subrutilus]